MLLQVGAAHLHTQIQQLQVVDCRLRASTVVDVYHCFYVEYALVKCAAYKTDTADQNKREDMGTKTSTMWLMNDLIYILPYLYNIYRRSWLAWSMIKDSFAFLNLLISQYALRKYLLIFLLYMLIGIRVEYSRLEESCLTTEHLCVSFVQIQSWLKYTLEIVKYF